MSYRTEAEVERHPKEWVEIGPLYLEERGCRTCTFYQLIQFPQGVAVRQELRREFLPLPSPPRRREQLGSRSIVAAPILPDFDPTQVCSFFVPDTTVKEVIDTLTTEAPCPTPTTSASR